MPAQPTMRLPYTMKAHLPPQEIHGQQMRTSGICLMKTFRKQSLTCKNILMKPEHSSHQKFMQLLWKAVTEIPYDLPIPLLDVYPREMKTYVHTKTYTQMFMVALFVIAKKWKQPKCPLTNR